MLEHIMTIFVRHRDLIYPLTATLMGAAMAASFAFLLTKPDPKSATIYDNFEVAVINVLEDGTQPDFKMLQLLYEAAAGKNVNAEDFKSGVRKALVRLHYNIASGETTKVPAEKIKDWLVLIRKNIEEYESSLPYQDLHPVERGLFQDIDALNDKPEIETKLRQLASVELARFEELESAKSEARWSLIFGFAGVVGALISIILAVWQAGQRSIKSTDQIS